MRAREDQFLALPCSGRAKIGMPRGHLYMIKDEKDADIGFMNLEDAQKKYGKDKIYISGSDTLCDTCYENIMNNIGGRKE